MKCVFIDNRIVYSIKIDIRLFESFLPHGVSKTILAFKFRKKYFINPGTDFLTRFNKERSLKETIGFIYS